jgi:hypothetical protein
MENYPFRPLFYVRSGGRDCDLPPDSYWNNDEKENNIDKETLYENFYENE